MPEHFRFVRGVVDSPDISLNISREMLQQTRHLTAIAPTLKRKSRANWKMMGSDREAYEKFWQAFGLQLKYGVMAEFKRIRTS